MCQAEAAGAGYMERRSEKNSEAGSGLGGRAPRSMSNVCLSRCKTHRHSLVKITPPGMSLGAHSTQQLTIQAAELRAPGTVPSSRN